jgi:hypothetical protein
MANCCFLTIHCTFDSEEWAAKYGEVMTGMWNYANSMGHMAYMGDWKRYLADADISTNGTEVDITGWTKWSLEHEQAFNVISFAKYITDNHLVMMTVDYSEIDDNIYGKYTYTRGVVIFDGKRDDRSGVVIDRYIPEDEWPDVEYDDDGNVTVTKGGCTWTDEDEALNDILQISGKEEVIHESL